MNLNTNLEDDLKAKNLNLKTFECPICLEVFDNPVNDNCGHTFCEECLKLCLSNETICPISKKEINNFAPNLILKHLFTQITLKCKVCSEDITLEEKRNHKIVCSLKKESKENIIKKYMELLSINKKLEMDLIKKNNLENQEAERDPIIY